MAFLQAAHIEPHFSAVFARNETDELAVSHAPTGPNQHPTPSITTTIVFLAGALPLRMAAMSLSELTFFP